MPETKTLILNAAQIQQRIDRIAYQIYENNYLEKEVVIAGIEKSGYVFAKRIAERLQKVSPIKVSLGKVILDKKKPSSRKSRTDIPSDKLKNKVVIVVDDVLNSGRTMMYALEPFLKFELKRLITIVLVDRSHHSYPIKADYVGVSLATTMQEHITVEFNGTIKDAVYLS